MIPTIERFGALMLTCAIVAMLARRAKLPYTIALLFSGIALAFVPFMPEIPLTKELIFSVLLPPLIFEAALFLPWKELRKVLPVVAAMASVGLLMAAVVTALGMHYLVGWPPLAAGIFGVLIAATDPVSVIATFKEAGVHGRLRILVEAESLFNDGSAAVMFGLVLAVASGPAPSVASVAGSAVLTVGGGILCGAGVASVLVFLAGRTEDHLVELTFTVVAAYSSFILAEHFGLSGVLATLTAGLIFGDHERHGAITEKGRIAVESFWEFSAFVANSLVFILIGMHEARQEFGTILIPSIVAIVVVLLGRILAIYPTCLLFRWSRQNVSIQHQHALVWGGLRGALALALALGLPDSMPMRGQIVTVSFAVVAFSIVVQGLTMTPFLRWQRLLSSDTTNHSHTDRP